MTVTEAIVSRHSVRKYLDKPIAEAEREQLDALTAECNAEGDLHIQMIYDDSECFPSLLAHYGMFRNAKNYIALVGKSSMPDLRGVCGYYGQRLVLAAQRMGLNTCWIGGSYKKKKTGAEIGPDEELVCIIAIGYGETQGNPHSSKFYDEVAKPSDAPEWFKAGVEAALLAPTALNQQKFTFTYKNGKVLAKTKFGTCVKTDLGIVKYHFELGAGKDSDIWL